MSVFQPSSMPSRRGAPGTSWAARVPEMKPMREMGDREWTWDQPRSFAEQFELRASGDLVASLGREAGMSPARPYHAATAEGEWILKRRSLLLPSLDVRRPGSSEPVAVYRPGWLGRGRTRMQSGLEYPWKMESFWRFEWARMDQGGSPLVSFQPVFSFARARAHVEVTGTALRLPDLAILTVLGWMLMLSSRRHAA